MNQAPAVIGDTTIKVLFKGLFLALVCAAAAWLSIGFSRGPAGLSTLWIPGGILCGVLVASPRRQWPVCILGVAATLSLVGVAMRVSGPVALVLVAAEMAEAVAVAWAVTRFVPGASHPDSAKATSQVAVTGTVAACALTATITAMVLAPISAQGFGLLWRNWFFSHVVGMVLFGTFSLVACVSGWAVFGRPGHRRELQLTIVLLALLTFVVFSVRDFSLPVLIYPPLLLAVFRHRFAGFVLGTTVVALISTAATVHGHGPFMLVPDATDAMRTLWLQVFIGITCLFTLPVAIVVTESRELTRRLAMSERDYRLLAENSHDIVVRMAPDGTHVYVSPATEEMLGWPIEQLGYLRWDLVHPDDVAALSQVLEKLRRDGGAAIATFRVRHQQGHFLWIEVHARLVQAARAGAMEDIVYSGRDVTGRVLAERALQDNQRHLRAITDNLPAFVLHLDANQRYTFANAFAMRLLGIDSGAIVGRTVREVLGDAVHSEIDPYMQEALRGETVAFEVERQFDGDWKYFQSVYVPDVDDNGDIVGLYAVSFDITELKHTQAELLRQTRRDALTGIANRRRFIERLELAVARSHRSGRPVALLYLDIDRFKHINDSFGHAAGDVVLREFARRLSKNVRDVDLVARMGGDEFVVVIEDIDSAEVAESIADNLLEHLRAPIVLDDGANVLGGASVGIAFSTHPVDDPETLLARADTALYEAKRAGRNGWRRAG
jgi:diguanylate cyclase (GGDEF)-like protein/PAS domain S-box-containing protein